MFEVARRCRPRPLPQNRKRENGRLVFWRHEAEILLFPDMEYPQFFGNAKQRRGKDGACFLSQTGI